MHTNYRISDIPYLKLAFISYILLGVTDTIHHFHAAAVLGHTTAFHAALIGIVLVPTACCAVLFYVKNGAKYLLGVFLAIALLAIALLAIAIPGLYHGGWNHAVKIIGYLRIDSPATEISTLFPSNNMNLWFYEVTGLLEFLFALVCSYFVYMLLARGKNSHHKAVLPQ